MEPFLILPPPIPLSLWTPLTTLIFLFKLGRKRSYDSDSVASEKPALRKAFFLGNKKKKEDELKKQKRKFKIKPDFHSVTESRGARTGLILTL